MLVLISLEGGLYTWYAPYVGWGAGAATGGFVAVVERAPYTGEGGVGEGADFCFLEGDWSS